MKSSAKRAHHAIIESWNRGQGIARDLYTGKALKISDAQIIPHDRPHSVVVGQPAILDFDRDGAVRSITLLAKASKVVREKTDGSDIHTAVLVATIGLVTGQAKPTTRISPQKNPA